jgi:NAD(P)-dependent dehydrogenase (short-subunit alcohol dehydrogenase family)
MRLKGKTVIVTGSSTGIGKAIALSCAQEGANVVVHGRSADRIDSVVEQIRSMGRESIGQVAEISKEDQVTQLVETVMRTYNTIDVLVNNAGEGIGPQKIENISEDMWDHVVDVLLYGPYYFCRSVIPIMQAQGYGSIVNVTSEGADFQIVYPVTSLPYVSAKAALRGMTRQLAWLYGGDGIRVNAVSPGDILTEKGTEWWDTLPSEEQDEALSRVAIGRMGLPDDVAGAITYLASDESAFVTGSTIRVNGGQFMS